MQINKTISGAKFRTYYTFYCEIFHVNSFLVENLDYALIWKEMVTTRQKN